MQNNVFGPAPNSSDDEAEVGSSEDVGGDEIVALVADAKTAKQLEELLKKEVSFSTVQPVLQQCISALVNQSRAFAVLNQRVHQQDENINQLLSLVSSQTSVADELKVKVHRVVSSQEEIEASVKEAKETGEAHDQRLRDSAKSLSFIENHVKSNSHRITSNIVKIEELTDRVESVESSASNPDTAEAVVRTPVSTIDPSELMDLEKRLLDKLSEIEEDQETHKKEVVEAYEALKKEVPALASKTDVEQLRTDTAARATESERDLYKELKLLKEGLTASTEASQLTDNSYDESLRKLEDLISQAHNEATEAKRRITATSESLLKEMQSMFGRKLENYVTGKMVDINQQVKSLEAGFTAQAGAMSRVQHASAEVAVLSSTFATFQEEFRHLENDVVPNMTNDITVLHGVMRDAGYLLTELKSGMEEKEAGAAPPSTLAKSENADEEARQQLAQVSSQMNHLTRKLADLLALDEKIVRLQKRVEASEAETGELSMEFKERDESTQSQVSQATRDIESLQKQMGKRPTTVHMEEHISEMIERSAASVWFKCEAELIKLRALQDEASSLSHKDSEKAEEAQSNMLAMRQSLVELEAKRRVDYAEVVQKCEGIMENSKQGLFKQGEAQRSLVNKDLKKMRENVETVRPLVNNVQSKLEDIETCKAQQWQMGKTVLELTQRVQTLQTMVDSQTLQLSSGQGEAVKEEGNEGTQPPSNWEYALTSRCLSCSRPRTAEFMHEEHLPSDSRPGSPPGRKGSPPGIRAGSPDPEPPSQSPPKRLRPQSSFPSRGKSEAHKDHRTEIYRRSQTLQRRIMTKSARTPKTPDLTSLEAAPPQLRLPYGSPVRVPKSGVLTSSTISESATPSTMSKLSSGGSGPSLFNLTTSPRQTAQNPLEHDREFVPWMNPTAAATS
ncbi:hypothetical protein CYMTET_39168 [Cymbomonas tetramitiformis]|uniref:Uncharacterized protein n=2 Tax=Cymbomonas tetramitiformis TaxID=36881 RepID=A0AAE0F4J2_9CHLO|nr:hypothetical protein CYMTET_39168 [Cymbomonas tetramitiformis]